MTTDDSAGQGDLERRWHREMVSIYEDAKKIGYQPARFIQDVQERGGLAAARHLINDYAESAASEGFMRLWELRRLDLSVEARALKPEYRPLFTRDERDRCDRRLQAYEWHSVPPWAAPARSGS
jgi:hypothetical protein